MTTPTPNRKEEIEQNQNYHNPIYSQDYVDKVVAEARESEREQIRNKCAETFHPYCGEPSCFSKLEKILKSLTPPTK